MTQSDAATDREVLTEQKGSLGRVHLNRPKALNSLTLGMVRDISSALGRFETDASIGAVLITGEGDRGFCAGGDIRALYESGKTGTDLAMIFWREEYIVNVRIDEFPKPYIAIMDGITMGGGVGVSAHGSHRIVTERTRFAMPETGIGFFPDVGGTWLLSRGPGEIGTYLGLTGAQIGPADAIYAGLADLFVPTAKLSALIATLEALPPGARDAQVSEICARFGERPPAGVLEANRAEIDTAFASDTLEEILSALARSKSQFAAATRAALQSKSPTSLKLTLRLLRLGRSSSLRECLNREFAACEKILTGHDFYEGVRAAVVDKDRNPRWSPGQLSDVSARDIEAYLTATTKPVFPA